MWSLTWQPYTQIKFLLLQKQIQKTGNLRILEGWQHEQCLCGPQYLNLKKNLFIYFWLCWVFVSVQAFLQLQRMGATLQLQREGFSLRWLLLLRSTAARVLRLQQLQHVCSAVAAPGPQNTGSVVAVCRFSCSAAHGIFLDQGLNPGLLHWQVDSLPPSHQGQPLIFLWNGPDCNQSANFPLILPSLCSCLFSQLASTICKWKSLFYHRILLYRAQYKHFFFYELNSIHRKIDT